MWGSFEVGAIRPPNEGREFSLLLRATRNCPWNRCTFCYGSPYHHEKFELRPVEEIETDIRTIQGTAQGIKDISWRLGCGGEVNSRVAGAILGAWPELGGDICLATVFNWLASGGKTAFLQDANSLVMRTPDLVGVLNSLRRAFPSLERVTSYARAHTLARKGLEELREIREAGLVRLHVGLESGDGEVLARVQKGVTPQEHIQAGKKALEAGFELSLYVMPGLGGKALSRQHALNTASVLNEIGPHFIRLRSLVPRPETPLYEEYSRGEFQLLSPQELIDEIYTLVENLEVHSQLF